MQRLNFLQILFLFLLNTSSASVFIGPEDEFEIKKIELYALKTNTNTDTSTYPISQRMLANTLSNYREIYQLVTFHEKLNSFLNQENEFKSEIKINLFSDLHPVRNISDDWKDKNSLSLKFGFYNKNFATQLNIHKSNKSFDDSSYYFDDSYISYTKWNMVFGFGALNLSLIHI